MDNEEIAATVVVPTTGDRGPLLRYSIGSILQQPVRDIEVFVIGDGVTDDARRAVEALASADSRVRFFDHPKHERRGEPNRHAALKSARGRIVCYLCDRDLMLPNHISRMLDALTRADFAFSLHADLGPDGAFSVRELHDFTGPGDRGGRRLAIPLSMVAHTMAFYRRLPFGWRTTPADIATDEYMWMQFFDEPDCRAALVPVPTIAYLKWGDYDSEHHLRGIERLYQRYITPGGADRYLADLFSDLYTKAYVGTRMRRLLRIMTLGVPIDRLIDRHARKRFIGR